MLLEKSGLDGLEKSIIQGEIKGNFTLSGVENALRAHWGDDAIKKRDGEAKHSLFQEDLEGDEPSPHDEEEAYFEGWADHEIAWYQEAKNDEQKAWIQFQGAKRTLREARARQHEVKMSRKFYKTTYPIGAGKNFQNRGAPPTKGPCFLCGERGHVKSECPKRQSAQYAEEEEVEQVHHTFHTTFMTQDEDIVASSHGDNYFFEETYGEGSTALEPEEVFHASTAYISTEAAVYQGKAILDGGATRTMGSLFALERYMHNMQEAHGTDGIKEISTSEVDRPTFGFGNSQRSKCLSTCQVQLPSKDKSMSLRVHVLEEGRAPVLLSVDSLRRMGAIIDFRNDKAVFTSVAPRTLLSLERSSSGHQLLPLTQDFLKEGKDLHFPVSSLASLIDKGHHASAGDE